MAFGPSVSLRVGGGGNDKGVFSRSIENAMSNFPIGEDGSGQGREVRSRSRYFWMNTRHLKSEVTKKGERQMKKIENVD